MPKLALGKPGQRSRRGHGFRAGMSWLMVAAVDGVEAFQIAVGNKKSRTGMESGYGIGQG